MWTTAEALLSRFIEETVDGRAPRVEDFVRAADPARRARLVEQIRAVQAAIERLGVEADMRDGGHRGAEVDEELLGDPGVIEAVARSEARRYDLPRVLRRRRAALRLSLDQLSGLLIGCLGLPATSTSQCRRYLAALETGHISARPVSGELLQALADILEADAEAIRGGGVQTLAEAQSFPPDERLDYLFGRKRGER